MFVMNPIPYPLDITLPTLYINCSRYIGNAEIMTWDPGEWLYSNVFTLHGNICRNNHQHSCIIWFSKIWQVHVLVWIILGGMQMNVFQDNVYRYRHTFFSWEQYTYFTFDCEYKHLFLSAICCSTLLYSLLSHVVYYIAVSKTFLC